MVFIWGWEMEPKDKIFIIVDCPGTIFENIHIIYLQIFVVHKVIYQTKHELLRN